MLLRRAACHFGDKNVLPSNVTSEFRLPVDDIILAASRDDV
jgi:hypothetical protein